MLKLSKQLRVVTASEVCSSGEGSYGAFKVILSNHCVYLHLENHLLAPSFINHSSRKIENFRFFLNLLLHFGFKTFPNISLKPNLEILIAISFQSVGL